MQRCSRQQHAAKRFALSALFALLASACSASTEGEPLAVFAAGSLGQPLKAALDSFALETGSRYTLETAGSLELARRMTELGRMPDLIALADEEVFIKLLMPEPVSWYVPFARNRVVLALSPRSEPAQVLTRDNWAHMIVSSRLAIGRADPDLDPAGYRALMAAQLVERQRGVSDVSSFLLSAESARNVRPKSADLVALLELGELDAAFIYESLARGAQLPFVALGDSVDLGTDSLAQWYGNASVNIAGQQRGESVTVPAVPIRYGISVPDAAAKRSEATALLRWLLGANGQRILRANFLDALQDVMPVGDGAPPLR